MAKREHTPKDAAIAAEIRRSLVEKIAYDVDKTLLTRCVVCGRIGFDHVETTPRGCTGFAMPPERRR